MPNHYVEEFNETEIYFILEIAIKRQLNNVSDERLRSTIEAFKSHLVNYGVGIDPANAESDFNEWFSFWKEWKSSLTIEELKDVIDRLKFGIAYDNYLPKDKWNTKK